MSRMIKSTSRTPMLRDSVEQVWLAGLGALALTEEEGIRFFKRLVKKGEGFEKETRARLDKVMTRAKAAPTEAIERFEAQLEDTRTGALHRLGVPTTREIDSLTRRVEGLADTLQRQEPAARRAPARRKTTASTRRRATTRS